MIINNKKYKGTHGLRMLSTNPDKKSLEDTYNLWWTNEDNYTEEDYNTYKEILNITHSVYQNNGLSSDKPKSSSGKKWNELVSPMWKEHKATKLGLGLKKYNENKIEYIYTSIILTNYSKVYITFMHKKKLVMIISITKKWVL